VAFEFGLMDYIAANVSTVSERVYTDTLPQDPILPAITCRRIYGIPEYSHSGSSDLEDGDFDVNIWADTALDREEVYAELRPFISGIRTNFGGSPGVSFIRNQMATYEPETGRYRKFIEVRAWHRESA